MKIDAINQLSEKVFSILSQNLSIDELCSFAEMIDEKSEYYLIELINKRIEELRPDFFICDSKKEKK